MWIRIDVLEFKTWRCKSSSLRLASDRCRSGCVKVGMWNYKCKCTKEAVKLGSTKTCEVHCTQYSYSVCSVASVCVGSLSSVQPTHTLEPQFAARRPLEAKWALSTATSWQKGVVKVARGCTSTTCNHTICCEKGRDSGCPTMNTPNKGMYL